MKKIYALTIGIMMSVVGTGVCAPADSFNDVPKDHWAYQAVNALAKDGLVTGYGDGEFKGDHLLTRYEFSMVVAKAIDKMDEASEQDKEVIDKLSAEFASELNRLGKRVAVVEKRSNTWLGGDTRVRFVANNPSAAGAKQLKGSNRFEWRQRFTIKSEIDKNTMLDARLTSSATNKFGVDTASSGSSTYFDIANITAKDVLGIDRVRVGRSAMDSIGHGLIGKPMCTDGLLLEKSFGDTKLKLYTGNPNGSPADNPAHPDQITTAELMKKLNRNMNLRLGYFWSDADAVETPNAVMGDLNVNGKGKAYDSSKGMSLAFDWQIGKYTLLTDYVMTDLNGVQDQRLSSKPKGWAIQFGNCYGPQIYYASGMLVDVNKAGADGWMVSYRSLDAGSIPNSTALGGFNTLAAANVPDPYSVFFHATDNVNVIYLAYQKVLRKNVVMSLEYQDFKIKDQGLTTLSSKQLDKTYQLKFQFFY